MTAKEQCLRRKNSYKQQFLKVLYCQCFLHNAYSNSCNKPTEIFFTRVFFGGRGALFFVVMNSGTTLY